jgi:hypothetical protein
MGFHHRKITPAWPKANSESERFMRTLNKTLRAAHLENKNWQQELFLFLRNYRATPHSTTGVSPAELLFGRKLGVKLPELIKTAPSRSLIADADMRQKAKMKPYVDTRPKAQHRTVQIVHLSLYFVQCQTTSLVQTVQTTCPDNVKVLPLNRLIRTL